MVCPFLLTRGFAFLAKAGYFRNITQSDFYQDYIAKLQAYLPLNDKFSFAVRTGTETIVGNSSVINSAQFYQHAVIGILQTSYGGGILIEPFYRISASVTYGVPGESGLLQVGIGTLF